MTSTNGADVAGAMVREARLRLLRIPVIEKADDPIGAGDRWATLADCRTALVLAHGVDVADIDATTGHDLTRRAYEHARDSWLRLIADDGGWTWWTAEHCAAAGANWARKRPQYVADLPWPAPPDEEAMFS